MNFFYWNKNFEVGIDSIDRQHRRLVDLINGLATAITEGGKLPDVQSLFGELMDYAAVHFSDEEALMATSSLPAGDQERHRKAHRGFVEKVREIIQRPDLLQTDVAEQVLEFLTTWLISHILGSDRKIAAALAPAEPEGEGAKSLFEISSVERLLLGALTETERRFRLISDHMPALIWVTDATGVRGFCNRAWTDFVRVDAESAAATDWREFIHPDDRPAYLELLERLAVAPEPAETEYRLRRHDGEYRWFLEKILPRVDSGNIFLGLVASATDISSIKQAEELLSRTNRDLEQEVARRTEQLEQLMLTDVLTGTGNRRMLMRHLVDETTRGTRYQRSLSAIFLDLDHFKRVNDAHGHATGDAVLVETAERLKSCLRECDLLSRFGGEEFVVLLPETGLADALRIAERMRNGVAAMRLTQVPEGVTISAGVAEWLPDESGEDLLRRSDHALYRAKQDGRNCCRVDPGAAKDGAAG